MRKNVRSNTKNNQSQSAREEFMKECERINRQMIVRVIGSTVGIYVFWFLFKFFILNFF